MLENFRTRDIEELETYISSFCNLLIQCMMIGVANFLIATSFQGLLDIASGA